MIRLLIAFLLSCSVAMAGQGMGPGPGVKGYATSGISATDNFNRTAADALGSLSGGTYTWSEVIGDIDLDGTKAIHGTSAGSIHSTAVLNSAISKSSGTLVGTLNAGSYAYGIPGLVFGYVDTNNYWVVQIQPSDGTNNLLLSQKASGAWEDIVTYDANLATNTDYTVTVRFTSSTVQVDIATIGTNLINTTGRTIASGNVGFKMFNTGDADNEVDNWSYTE